MARDGMLPPSFFAAVHERFRTPWKSTILTGVFRRPARGLLAPINILLNLVNMGTLFAFAAVCIAVLDHAQDAPRGGAAVSLSLGAGRAAARRCQLCLLLMFSLPSENWLRLFGWMALGLRDLLRLQPAAQHHLSPPRRRAFRAPARRTPRSRVPRPSARRPARRRCRRSRGAAAARAGSGGRPTASPCARGARSTGRRRRAAAGTGR